ncbi:hypothetical protein VKT23_007315 [Stygiomarasmius scandens]|uniref:Uncharacterized protein n=1 Tax=Marasmiellus scandens TaxID=2682957 RepID=A0ABR1JMA7_9AGAR
MSHLQPVDPITRHGVDQIMELVRAERAEAIVATRRHYDPLLDQQAREITCLEETLKATTQELQKMSNDGKRIVAECNRLTQDLQFVCKALDEELGVYVSSTFDEEKRVWSRKLAMREVWRDFLLGMVSTGGTGGSADTAIDATKIAEYPYLWNKEPVRAAVALRLLRHIVLRDREALDKAQAECKAVEKEKADLLSQIANLEAKVDSLQPPKFIDPTQLLHEMQSTG